MARTLAEVKFPKTGELMLYILQALKDLGGAASVKELNSRVIDQHKMHDEAFFKKLPKNANQTELGLRLAWGRSNLKKLRYIDSPGRGQWELVDKNIDLTAILSDQLAQEVVNQNASEAGQGRAKKAPRVYMVDEGKKSQVMPLVMKDKKWKGSGTELSISFSKGKWEIRLK